MPPVYLTPKSSATSPDGMAVCPIPPHRNNNVNMLCQVFMGPMNVPKLKLPDCDDDDDNLGFFLAAPSNIPGFCDDDSEDEALSSFVPIERAHRSRSVPTIKIRLRPSVAFAGAAGHIVNGLSPTPTTGSVPIIKIRPRPLLAFAGAAARNNMSIGISPPSPTDTNDNEKEEEVALTSPAPFVLKAKATKSSTTAIAPTSTKTSSMKNSSELAVLNSKRLKVGSSVTTSAAAQVLGLVFASLPFPLFHVQHEYVLPFLKLHICVNIIIVLNELESLDHCR